jgi:hypothetical protein
MICFQTLYHFSSGNVTVTPGKKLVLPGEYFEFIGDVPGKNASLYRCLFPRVYAIQERCQSQMALTI